MASLSAKTSPINDVGRMRGKRCAHSRHQTCVRPINANDCFISAQRDALTSSASRRHLLVGIATLPWLANVPVSAAEENGYKKFLGAY